MSEIKVIQKIYPYPIKWGELSTLSNEDKAVFTMLSFASSEINSLRKLCLLSMSTLPEKPLVEHAISIQRNLLLRTMTAKLFEFIEFFHAVKRNRPAPEKTLKVFISLSSEMKMIKKHPGYRIAHKIRNKMANHYDLPTAILSIKGIADDLNCDFFLAPESGNNYFPMGDSIIFSNPVEAYVDEDGVTIDSSSMVHHWMEWTLLTSGFVEKLQFSIIDQVVTPLFKNRKARERIEWLPEQLKVKSDDFTLPVFIGHNP